MSTSFCKTNYAWYIYIYIHKWITYLNSSLLKIAGIHLKKKKAFFHFFSNIASILNKMVSFSFQVQLNFSLFFFFFSYLPFWLIPIFVIVQCSKNYILFLEACSEITKTKLCRHCLISINRIIETAINNTQKLTRILEKKGIKYQFS